MAHPRTLTHDMAAASLSEGSRMRIEGGDDVRRGLLLIITASVLAALVPGATVLAGFGYTDHGTDPMTSVRQDNGWISAPPSGSSRRVTVATAALDDDPVVRPSR